MSCFSSALISALLFLQPAKAPDNTRRITISPQAMPTPGLKYQFVVPGPERRRGNAAHLYLKCFAEQNNFWYGKDQVKERAKLADAPLEKLKGKEFSRYGGSALTYADEGARCTQCDWQIEEDLRAGGVAVLLPDLQMMRMIARGLVVRARAEMARGDFDAAAKSIRTMFSLARHCGKHPTAVGNLVGAAISAIAFKVLDEFVAQPNAPNLYWALSTYPSPVMPIRSGWETERQLVTYTFGKLLDGQVWDKTRVADARKQLAEFGSLMFNADNAKEMKEFDAYFQKQLGNAKWIANARAQLIKAGGNKKKVAGYPPEQVLFYHLDRKFQLTWDEHSKWALLPYRQAIPMLNKAPKTRDMDEKIVAMAIAPWKAIKTAQVRVDQRIAMLRIVEGIRYYASQNKGKLPPNLNAIGLPFSDDPVTGKPFQYEMKEGVGFLKNTPPSGRETVARFRIRYEIRVRK